ncbi:helix-turn-helix domain-containing protein [Pedobacter sp. WC2501]|uniref:helix-turn-helix domain-containing protein n=1 Tax=Pedobacter sp. WC2501 TaxID=3461400 RepID=UPI00404590CC
MSNSEKTLTSIENLLLNNKEVFTIDDLCKYTGLSKSFVYKKTATQSIPHYKPSNKILIFKKSEIDAWLLKNKISTLDDIEQQAINFVTGKTWNGGRNV